MNIYNQNLILEFMCQDASFRFQQFNMLSKSGGDLQCVLMSQNNNYVCEQHLSTESYSFELVSRPLYTWGRPEHSLISCGVLGGTILAPNHWALDESLGRVFPRPELPI